MTAPVGRVHRRRVVVAHEWLTNWAGSERVAREMATVGGASSLVTCIADRALAAEYFPDLVVRPLWPSFLPGAGRHWSRYVLPMLHAWATTTIDADLLLVSSHFSAHAATRRFTGPSIVYYHTPARILWRSDIEISRLPPAARMLALAFVLPILRLWDRRVSAGPTVVLANSSAVARRIAEAYGRPAEVIHPPVDIATWMQVVRGTPEHFLWLGRLVPYKRPDLAVEAARLSGLPLVIVGEGPERARLEASAPANVRFVGRAPDDEVRGLMARSYGLLFPGEEDFGIAPVEAMAAGVPIIAYAAGGACDYLLPDVNGIAVKRQDPVAFAHAMDEVRRRTWDTAAVRSSVQEFGPEHFRAKLQAVIDRTLGCTPAAAMAAAHDNDEAPLVGDGGGR